MGGWCVCVCVWKGEVRWVGGWGRRGRLPARVWWHWLLRLRLARGSQSDRGRDGTDMVEKMRGKEAGGGRRERKEEGVVPRASIVTLSMR